MTTYNPFNKLEQTASYFPKNIGRWDIYYIENVSSVGNEQSGSRPAIVVESEDGLENSNVYKVVYMTTQKKTVLPTHVKIKSAKYESTALCEQIHSVSSLRFGAYINKCSDEEIKSLEKALYISLGLKVPITENNAKTEEVEETEVVEEPLQEKIILVDHSDELNVIKSKMNELDVKLQVTQAQLEIYKRFYDDYISRNI